MKQALVQIKFATNVYCILHGQILANAERGFNQYNPHTKVTNIIGYLAENLENHCDHFGEQVKAGQGDSGERQRPPLLPGDRAGDGWLRVERKGI